MTHPRLLAVVGMIVSMFALVGCGAKTSGSNSARVSGAITFNGQPIKGGRMEFHDKSGLVYLAALDADGTYQANDIPEGELVVTVETESLKASSSGKGKGESKKREEYNKEMDNRRPGGAAPPAPPPSTTYIKIPAKYGNPKTSPLTANLKPGRQVQNFDLTD